MTTTTLPVRTPGAMLRDRLDTAAVLLALATERGMDWPRSVDMGEYAAGRAILSLSCTGAAQAYTWCACFGDPGREVHMETGEYLGVHNGHSIAWRGWSVQVHWYPRPG